MAADQKLDFIQNELQIDGVLIHGAYSQQSILATKNFQGLADDVFLTTYPRTGTTWTQNILVGLCYGLDTVQSTKPSFMRQNFPYMEQVTLSSGPGYELADQIERRPRLMKTHLPVSLAPQEIFTKKRRNIVVVRNPKDTAVSAHAFYHSAPSMKAFAPAENFDDFFPFFLNGKVNYGSWWDWTKDWIAKCRLH